VRDFKAVVNPAIFFSVVFFHVRERGINWNILNIHQKNTGRETEKLFRFAQKKFVSIFIKDV